MKVKYLLALALSHHAELLILDEPTSGLDPVSREELLQIFRQIVQKRNVLHPVFYPHHSDLDKCADDITYIQNGRVLQSADKETFLQSFAHLKTPQDAGPLTLEEIMLRTERSEWDDGRCFIRNCGLPPIRPRWFLPAWAVWSWCRPTRTA